MSKISDIDIEELKDMIATSNSFKELQVKIGYSPNSGRVRNIIETYCKENNISLNNIISQAPQRIERTPENTFIEHSTASQAVLRRLYFKGNYSEYKCSICGQEPFWNGKELTLTLDHINGHNTDDRLENLRWVCPNCDRQLDTFGSKNILNSQEQRINAAKKWYCQSCGKEITHDATLCPECYALSQRKVADRPNAEELTALLKQNKGNFTAVGRIFNVTDNTIRKWCKGYSLPFHSADYK